MFSGQLTTPDRFSYHTGLGNLRAKKDFHPACNIISNIIYIGCQLHPLPLCISTVEVCLVNYQISENCCIDSQSPFWLCRRLGLGLTLKSLSIYLDINSCINQEKVDMEE